MLDFPNSPTVGDVFFSNGLSWSWDGEKWTVSSEIDTSSLRIMVDLSTAVNPNNVIPEIQAAVDRLPSIGGHIILSAGVYKATSELFLKGGIILEGTDTTLDYTNAETGNWISARGSVSSEINISTSLTSSDNVCNTASTHGFAIENDVLLVSQRNALSADAGDLQLGLPTGGTHANYFAEPLTVKAVVSSTQFEFAPPLRFVGYEPVGHTDQNQYARPSSTVRKINWCQFVRISGIRFIAGNGTNRLLFEWCKYCRVEKCHFEMGSKQGTAISFSKSYMTEANQCTTRHDANISDVEAEFPSLRASFSPGKVFSCWSCGFVGCADLNGAGGWDVSYNDYEYPSVGSYVTGCRAIGNGTAGASSHSGTYATLFTNNHFINCRSGIFIRSRMAIASNNIIIGWGRLDKFSTVNYGIVITGGWAQESIISNNTIDNFGYGIQYGDASSLGGRVDGRLLITNNQVKSCTHGIYLDHNSGLGPTTLFCNIRVTDNQIYAPDIFGIFMDPYINGAFIDNNFISGPLRFNDYNSAGIYQSNNSAENRISRNMFVNLGSGVQAIKSDPLNNIPQTDLVTFPLATYPHLGNEYSGNRVIGDTLADYSVRDITVVRERLRKWAVNAASAALWENRPSTLLYLVSDNANISSIWFADEDTGTAGAVRYNNAAKTLTLNANSGSRHSVSSTASYPYTDNSISSGLASNRWSTVYAATGTINTSDARDKADITTDIDPAVLRAVDRITFSQFTFREAVDRKGSNARLHFGALGQQIQEAFEAEGLDAFRYGLLCYDEWEAEYEDVLDPSGQPTGERRVSVEAGSRLGVRYDELFALKLASLERERQAISG